MTGLFMLKKSYVLGGLCVPLIGFTFLFRFMLNKAYGQNGRNLPMQILRDNHKESPNTSGSDTDSDDYSSCDETERTRSKSNVAALEVAKTKEEEEEKQNEIKMAARNRWKKAAFSAANLKAEIKAEPKPEDKNVIVRPRHKKVVLDEDDYEATPDRATDYRQPPMQLNPGLLDAGLKRYGNPLLVGVLPQLWLPVKVPVKGEDKRPYHNRRKSDLLHNRISGGGNLAQHLAEILRKVEADNKAEEEQRIQTASSQGLMTSKPPSRHDELAKQKLMDDSKKIAQNDAASIAVGPKPNPKIKALRALFHRGAITKENISTDGTKGITPAEDFKMKHINDDAATLDSVERGQGSHNNSRRGTLDDHASSRTGSSRARSSRTGSSNSAIHQVYYHHPERRKSRVSNSVLPLPSRPEYVQSGLSAPALVPFNVEDNESLAEDIVRPDTQNSRYSSAPLLKKVTKDDLSL